jgi:TPR repeat protein
MLHLARYYDPSDEQPHGSIIKDAEQAAAWYARAAAAGIAEAQDALQMLKDWQVKNE